MGTRIRVGIGLSFRPARLHRLAESIPVLLKNSVADPGMFLGLPDPDPEPSISTKNLDSYCSLLSS